MKKLLAVLLMVSMLALMLPISALALVDYEISVADVAVTGQNAADVLGDGTVSYDPGQNVLTLKNANIVGNIDIGREEITLKLVGANKLQAPGDAIECIAMDVVGDGSLEILAGSDGFDYDYDCDLTVGGSVSIVIKCDSDGFMGGALTIKDDASVRINSFDEALDMEYDILLNTTGTLEFISATDSSIMSYDGKLTVKKGNPVLSNNDEQAEVVFCPEIVMEGGLLDAKGGVIWFEECSGIDKIDNAIMADMMSGESLVLGDAKIINHQVLNVYTMELADGASLVNHGKIRIDTVMEESWRGNGLIEDDNGIWNSAGEEIEAVLPLYCEEEDFAYGGAAWDADTKTLTLDHCVVNGDIHLPQGDVTVKVIGESSVLSLITTLAPITSITVTGDTLTAMAVHSTAIVVEEGATLYTSDVDVAHLTVNGYLDAERIETETLERGAKGTLCFKSLFGYIEVEEGELLPAVESLCRLNGADLNGAVLDYYCPEENSVEYYIEMSPEGYGNCPCIAPAVPYTDVAKNQWFADTVAEVYSRGLMNGITPTAFAPDATASRAMVATVLWRMEGCPEANISNPFTDVPADAYYKDAMLWAVEVGIINGYLDHTFKGNQSITREELAVMFYRYAEYKGMDLRFTADLTDFTDDENVAAWSETAVEWNVEMGIVQGADGGKLLPQGNATRAQMATMLIRVVRALRPSGFVLML